MITLLTALFYLWLVITILLVAMWFLRRLDHLRGPDDDHDLGHGSPAARRASRSNRQARDDGSAEPGAAGRVDTTEADRSAERIEVGLRSQPVALDNSGDRGRSAKPDRGRGKRRNAADRQAAPTIAELLDGASLPYDLTPTDDRITEPDRHAIFLSTNSDVEAVGTAFADELVRLGFVIEPDGLDRARAVRGHHVMMLRIGPRGATPGRDNHRRYPPTGENNVAIEIWTGQDLPPQSA